MQYANANTARNIETCGILCGKLDAKTNDYVITLVILPKQTGTSDTTTTSGEELLIDVQERTQTVQLGWIHTHPTQSCFLSSIDLHTSFTFQVMMPESIAIVMAPCVKPPYGVFHITPKGMGILSKCNRSGFHRHTVNDGLFTTAQHALFDRPGKTEFVDLRGK
jgi:STAM-binding protein